MEIQGFPNYLIYDDGRVFNRKYNRFLDGTKNEFGYLSVGLSNGESRKLFKIHRLVALQYIPNPENKPDVNHIDGDKTNNNIENLEWATRAENCNAFKKTPTINTSGVKNITFNKCHKLWVYQKINYGERIVKYFKTFEEACEYKNDIETI
tara:strand:- start:17 stop:469 length:453 start_codon:yes stop_codon:yes gene_type:complete